MKLIDRYIYTVTRHLPAQTQSDVAKELRTNIEAMLSDDPTPGEVEAVLKDLGNPWLLANEYQPNKRYLIGPNYFDNYVSVLKLVIAIVTAVVAILTVVARLIDPPVVTSQVQFFTDTFVSVFSGIFNAILQAIFWVTLVFVMLERSGQDLETKPDWRVTDLPEVPVVKISISRVESAVEIALIIFLTLLILSQPQVFGYFSVVTENGADVVTQIPLFELTQLRQYYLLIIASSAITVFIAIWKFMAGQWNLKLILGNIAANIVGVVTAAVILLDPRIFNYQFYEKLAGLFSVSPLNVELTTKYMGWVVVVFIVLLALLDSIVPMVKWFKAKRAIS